MTGRSCSARNSEKLRNSLWKKQLRHKTTMVKKSSCWIFSFIQVKLSKHNMSQSGFRWLCLTPAAGHLVFSVASQQLLFILLETNSTEFSLKERCPPQVCFFIQSLLFITRTLLLWVQLHWWCKSQCTPKPNQEKQASHLVCVRVHFKAWRGGTAIVGW